MRRFFVKEIVVEDGSCIITGSEARHIAKALRMGRGDRIILLDNQGVRYQSIIESVSPRGVRVKFERPLPSPSSSPIRIILCQALLKSRAMDQVIEKASELGVHYIHPFDSERTVVKLDGQRAKERVRRWQDIIHSATTQSDGRAPAEIGTLLSFSDLTTKYQKKSAMKVIFWEDEEVKDLKGLLRESSPATEVIGMVGPEGGFTQEEIRVAEQAGFTPVSLGQRVLKAETAAITMTAIIQYEWGDLSLDSPLIHSTSSE
ncbi:MAG: 16S rRNA (uracil(1498)-N(3))-methyltransferase [Deltaproteobacteria bacterium]|nr:16S rRNA (uracil(1498)-N(3))-methyltransferase [Deltaproteobacteria bacterium]